MCGRIFQTLPLGRLLQIARSKKCTNEQQHTSSFNVCPTTYIPVIKPNRFYMQQKHEQVPDEEFEKEECRELQFMKWGCNGKFNFVINGRIEELLNKRMFLNIINNRCVVILQGYYEWNEKKDPFSLRPKEGDHFLVAGLYTDQKQIIILTKDATPELAKVHSRMPVILSHEEVNLWMNPKNTKDIQNIISKSLLKKDKEVWKNVGFARVAPYVSNIKEKSVKCLMTVDEYKKQLDKTGLMKYWKKAPAVEAVGTNGEVIKQGIQPEDNIQKQIKKNDVGNEFKQENNTKQPIDQIKSQAKSQKIEDEIRPADTRKEAEEQK